MEETVLKKQFNERDLQRVRNLVQKKYNDKTILSVGYTKIEEKHDEGIPWEEDGRMWVMKNGIKCTVRKINAVAFPLLCPKCSKPMNHPIDKKMYGIHQMCLHCVCEMESELKMQGKYEEYEREMIKSNSQYLVKNVESGLDQFMDSIINETYVTEDGVIQKWVGNGLDKEEIKQQIKNKLQKIQNTIS